MAFVWFPRPRLRAALPLADAVIPAVTIEARQPLAAVIGGLTWHAACALQRAAVRAASSLARLALAVIHARAVLRAQVSVLERGAANAIAALDVIAPAFPWAAVVGCRTFKVGLAFLTCLGHAIATNSRRPHHTVAVVPLATPGFAIWRGAWIARPHVEARVAFLALHGTVA